MFGAGTGQFSFTATSRWRTFVFFIILNNLLRGGRIPRPLLNSKNIKVVHLDFSEAHHPNFEHANTLLSEFGGASCFTHLLETE